MNSRNPAFPVVPQMLFPPSGAAGFIATTESTAHEETVDSVGAVHGLFSQLLPGDIRVRIWGALLVYGDPKPKPEGYFEFYDRATNLLAVGWFDHHANWPSEVYSTAARGCRLCL